MVKQMVRKTIPEPVKIIIDEKGIKQKSRLKELLKDYEVVFR